MPRSVARLSVATLIALAGIYFGLRLALYADQDDSPGGMVIGCAIMFGAVGLAIWFALRQPKTTD
jgi:hypothetical protein